MKAVKIALAVAGALLGLGLLICIIAFSVFGFRFNKLNTASYEITTYDVKDKFDSISVKTTIDEVTFHRSADGKNRVVCKEEENVRHEVSVKNGVLTVERVDMKKVNFGVAMEKSTMEIYLSDSAYDSLQVRTDTGDVSIPADFSFGSIEIEGDTADVSCAASADGRIRIHTDTGDITAELLGAGEVDLKVTTGAVNVRDVNCAGALSVKVSTGRVKLEDVRCASLKSEGDTGRITLKNVLASGEINIRRSTGEVEFDRCDAEEIYVKTDTGDVTGTFLSEKVVFAETDTGKVKVPKTVNGGRCEISTDTGDIEISFVN